MRAKRILWVSLLAAAAAVGVCFVPAVQLWVAREALASVAPAGTTLQRVSMRPGHVSVGGLHLELGGAVLDVPEADARLGVVQALLGKGYFFRDLVARGWTLDLTHPHRVQAAAAAGARGLTASGAVGALLAAFNVPAEHSIDGVDLEGEVIFPDGEGRPVGRAHVVLTGGDLAAGRDGRFNLSADASLSDAAAAVSSVALKATLTVGMDLSGTLVQADLKARATATGPQFPQGIGISAGGTAARGAGRTSYSLALLREQTPIASFDAVTPDGSQRLSGRWKLNLKDSDVAPFALGRTLPSFEMAGAGTYDLDTSSGDIHAEGKVESAADRLGHLQESLSVLGRVRVSADFDFARSGDSLRVDRLDTSLAGASAVGTVRALQPFEFNVSSGELKVAQPSGDLVGFSVVALPLAWLQGLFPAISLTGGAARGEFVMRAENGRLALRTKVPLTSSGVSLADAGRVLACGLDVSTFLLADYTLDGWQLQFAPLEVRGDGVKILSLEARLGRLAEAGQPVKAAGSWSAFLPALLKEPVFAGLPALASGEASGSFEASLGATREYRVKVELGALALVSGDPASLPSAKSDARLDFFPDGRWEFNAPVRLDYGGRTAQIDLSGSVGGPSEARSVDAWLAADRLGPQEAALYAALMGSVARPAPDPASIQASVPAASGAARPLWPRVDGRLSFAVQDADLGRIEVHNLRGTLTLTPGSLRLDSGMASTGESSAFRADGELSFSPDGAGAYALTATVSADNLDSAPLFKAISPDRPPVIEGTFDVAAHLKAAGAGARELLAGVQGDCRLSSKGGRFRALHTGVLDEAKQASSRISEALDSVTSLFGKKAEKLAEALAESADGLSEVRYDQMGVALERGPDLDVVITEISLIAPEERITGSGRISHSPGLPVEAQPLSVDLAVGVRGNLARYMGLVGLLAEGHDEMGYTQLYQGVHLGGTLQDIDRSQLKEMLVQAPLRKGGGLIDKLLGR